MRTRIASVLGLTLVLILPLGAGAAEEAPLLITGGGQVVASTDMQTGPGDTIAFVALQERGTTANSTGVVPADGSTQVVKTSVAGGGSQPPIIFNGEVTCIDTDGVEGGTARFGGITRSSQGSTTGAAFVVDVVDSGDESRGTDMIEFRFTSNDGNPCDDNQNGSELNGTTLARGNLKVDTASSGRR